MSSGKQEQRQTGGGLSIQTLAIASLSSLAAAVVIHEFWQGGAILGAAVTPVIVAIVSEALRRPADRVTAVVAQRRTAPASGRVAPAGAAPAPRRAPVRDREDRFGLYEDRARTVRRRRLRLGLVTGLVAFAIAAFVLTGTELVIGNPLGGSGGGTSSGGGGGTTIFGGGGSDEREEREQRERDREEPTQQEQEAEEPTTTEEEPAPAPQEGTPEEDPAPDPAAPESGPEAAPESQAAPEAAPQQPTEPAPQGPAPDPGGAPAP